MLYLSSIFLSIFLSFVLITRNHKTAADYILVAWLAVTGFHLLTFYLVFTNQFSDFPVIAAIGIPLPLAQGPFLYLYTRQQTSPAPFKIKLLLHFLPLLLSYILFARFFFLPHEEEVAVFNERGRGFEMQSLINLYLIYFSGIVYIILSLILLLKFRRSLVNQFSNTEKINFNWLLYLIVWLAVIWIVILITQDDKLIFGAASLFVLWLGYFGIKQVQVFSQKLSVISTDIPKTNGGASGRNDSIEKVNTVSAEDESSENLKYQKSPLSEQEASLIHERLKQLMSDQKPFTNPDLTLNELAKSLDVHPNYLSQVINSKEKRTFYDLINERRVEEFIQLVSKPFSQQYTLLALAFDCGFNSKASFNRNFKKYTGCTPSDYLKQQPA